MIDFTQMGTHVEPEEDNTVLNVEPGPIRYFPPEAMEVILSTGGRLSAPARLHVTDYTMDDVLKLSTSNQESLLNDLMEVLQHRIQDEGISVDDLHENEFEELAFTLYYTHWSHVINDYPYPWTKEEVEDLAARGVIDEKRKEKILSGKEIPRINLPLQDIEIMPIPEGFKEPIVVTTPNGIKLGFRLPRIGDYRMLDTALKAKYFHEDMEYLDVKRRMQRNREEAETAISSHRLEEYRNYERRRALDLIKLRQGLLILWVEGTDGKRQTEFTNEDRIALYGQIDRKVWMQLNKALENLKFGINHEIPIQSPFTGEIVKRRCSFQILDFIPTNDVPDGSGYDLSFGDEA